MAKRIKLQDRQGNQLLPLTRSELVQVSQITGLNLLDNKVWTAATVQDVLAALNKKANDISTAEGTNLTAIQALQQKLQSFEQAQDSVKNYVNAQDTAYLALAYTQSAADAKAAEDNAYAYAGKVAGEALAAVDFKVTASAGYALTGFEVEDGDLKSGSIQEIALTSSNVTRTATTGDHGVAATNVEGAIIELSTKIDTSYTNAEAYTDEKVNGLKSTLNGTITAESGKVFTSITQTNGVLSYTDAALTASDITRTATGKVDGTTVEAALANLADSIQTGGTGSVITVEEVTTGLDSSVLKAYKIWQGSTSDESNLKGTINIPKDLVVTAGAVVNGTWSNDTFTEGSGTDKALKLTIANQTAPVYINPTDFIDVYTANNQTSEVTVAIDANNNITATVGKIAASKVDYTTGNDGETVAQALARIDTALGAGGSVASQIQTEIQKLNADLDASGTAQHSGTFVMSGVTEVDGKITAVDSVEVEAAGTAAAVQTAVEAHTINGKALSTNPVLYAGDIATSSTDATTVAARLTALETGDGNSVKSVNGQTPTGGAVTVNASQIDTVNTYKLSGDAAATTHNVDAVLAEAVFFVDTTGSGTYDNTTI